MIRTLPSGSDAAPGKSRAIVILPTGEKLTGFTAVAVAGAISSAASAPSQIQLRILPRVKTRRP
jgi:hypothetical protein